jgi:molybdenum cofactor cytidylyltransferase
VPPIAERAALNLRPAVGRVLAVVPPAAAELEALLARAGCEILATDRTARGMGSSLAAGIEAAARADGWIVALGDMPAIDPATIGAVARALAAGAPIAAPFDATGRRGHPVAFGAALRAELLALEGDSGARAVIERHAAALQRVPVDDPGIFIDIDTREDLRKTGLSPTGG